MRSILALACAVLVASVGFAQNTRVCPPGTGGVGGAAFRFNNFNHGNFGGFNRFNHFQHQQIVVVPQVIPQVIPQVAAFAPQFAYGNQFAAAAVAPCPCQQTATVPQLAAAVPQAVCPTAGLAYGGGFAATGGYGFAAGGGGCVGNFGNVGGFAFNQGIGFNQFNRFNRFNRFGATGGGFFNAGILPFAGNILQAVFGGGFNNFNRGRFAFRR